MAHRRRPDFEHPLDLLDRSGKREALLHSRRPQRARSDLPGVLSKRLLREVERVSRPVHRLAGPIRERAWRPVLR